MTADDKAVLWMGGTAIGVVVLIVAAFPFLVHVWALYYAWVDGVLK